MRLTETSKALSKWSFSTVEEAKKIIKIPGSLGQKNGRKKSSSGKLASSLGFQITESPNGLTTKFTSSVDYAAIVHDGRKKNSRMPPIAPIVRWMKQKPVRLRAQGGQFRKQNEKAFRQAAFVIARSISRRGIKPFPFMAEAMNKEFDKLPDELAQAMVMDMEDLLFEDFQKTSFKVTRT